MASEFNKAIDVAAKVLAMPVERYEKFAEHAEIISNAILDELKNQNSIFKDTILNLKATALYRNENEMDIFLILKMPFDIKPIFDGTSACILKANVNHPIVVNGKINSGILNMLFSVEMRKAISVVSSVSCPNGKTYNLECITSPHNHKLDIHQISAIELVEVDIPEKILFHFMLAFKFLTADVALPNYMATTTPLTYWLASQTPSLHPTFHGYNFICFPYPWQLIKRSDGIKFGNLSNLLFRLHDSFKIDEDFPIEVFTKYVFKTLVDDPIDFIQQPLAVCLIDILRLEMVFLKTAGFISDYSIWSQKIGELLLRFEKLKSSKKIKLDDVISMFKSK